MSTPTLEQETPSSTPVPTLTKADRCDRCGAEAKVRVGKASADLDFCGHHYRAQESALTESGWLVLIDVTAADDVRPGASTG